MTISQYSSTTPENDMVIYVILEMNWFVCHLSVWNLVIRSWTDLLWEHNFSIKELVF